MEISFFIFIFLWFCRLLCDAGNLEEAIEHLTEAILLNPVSAIMYATRGMLPLTGLEFVRL